MIKAIVFDFDGVVVDSEPLHYRAFVQVAKPLGVTITWEQYLQEFIGYDDRDAFRVMLGGRPGMVGTPKNEAKLAQLGHDKAVAFENEVRAGFEPIPGILALIEQAHQQWPLAIASGATRFDIDLILGELGLADRFSPIVTADDVQYSKPHPQTYAKAVGELGFAADPSACLAIEDTAAGIESAREAGLQVLGITSTGDASQLGRATRVVETFQGITPQQLEQWFGG